MRVQDNLIEVSTNNIANIGRFDRVIAIAEKYSDILPSETIWTEEQMNLSVRRTPALQVEVNNE
jgi:hypothetical protein